MENNSFEDAIRKAISWGGDSDTIGAIVSSMAEALCGVPQDIKNEALSTSPVEALHVMRTFTN